MKCFLCNINTNFTVKTLILHLQYIHSLTKNSTYECCEGTCSNKSFSNVHSFRKHINRKHLTENIISSTVQTQPITPINIEHKTQTTVEFNPELHTKDDNFSFSIDSLSEAAVKFSLILHNNDNFSRKNVEEIQRLVIDTFLAPATSYLKEYIVRKIEDVEIRTFLLTFIEKLSNPFKCCKTDYLLHSWLKENNLLNELVQFSVNETVGVSMQNGEPMYAEQVTKGIVLPLKFQIKKHFEKGNNFNDMLANIKNKTKQSELISSFINGKLWQNKISKYNGDICIPYFLFTDDFQINNPLGTQCQSVLGIYYSFPLANNISKLDNIFVAGFIKSQDIKKFGNDACLAYLINNINEIESTGISLNTMNGIVNVRFILGLVVGDNLGINSICDFSKSFSSSFFCRFCKTPKSETHRMAIQDDKYMRNLENYRTDVDKHCFEETGIVEDSCLNKIHSFHVVENYAVDIMHDLFEGICHYDVCRIFQYYIDKVKILTLDTLNFRKQSFNYGSIEIGNLSRPITSDHIKRCKLKMTASEMKAFIHLLPLMIGDLIPENDNVWEFLLLLLQIINLLLRNEYSIEDITLLRHLIYEHNKKYVELFSDTLKPKHHILVHYPTVIEFSGPPKHFWSFRYEAKHKAIKAYANVISSRKNILLTLAKKCNLKASLLSMTIENNSFFFKDKHRIESKNLDLLFAKTKIKPQKVLAFSEINYKGTVYKKGLIVSLFKLELSIFEIEEIFILEENSEIFLLVNQFLVESYSSHLDAFEINSQKQYITEQLFFKIIDFKVLPANIHCTVNGNLMYKLKEYL